MVPCPHPKLRSLLLVIVICLFIFLLTDWISLVKFMLTPPLPQLCEVSDVDLQGVQPMVCSKSPYDDSSFGRTLFDCLSLTVPSC